MLPLLAALVDSPQPVSVADTPPPRRTEIASANVPETSFIAGLGVTGGENAGGVAVSAQVTHRYHFLEVGGECHAAALFSSMLGVGGVAGFHFGNAFSVRLLGAAGVHLYDGVGRGLLTDDPGISGSLPYAGGRLVLGYSFPQRRSGHRAFIGLAGMYDRDLARRTSAVTYREEDAFFGGDSYEATSTHTLGQTSVSGFLLAGVSLDLTGY
jgi:hypothetical protein